jgi:serine phosphatase RsbU (regulator of sigma subunit)
MINIIVGASFMFKRAIVGQILVGFLAILTGGFLYLLGTDWENATLITFILLAFTILFSRAHSYLNLQQERIQNKNREIERKNKEITDSINYGRRIQTALQKKVDRVDNSLFPDVILYRPKDIVSGDFYWKFQQGDYFYFCVADCTGHGIPGAFMSVLGLSFLQEIMSRNDAPMPHEILNQLRDKIANELSQSDDINASKDGMDASVIRIHSGTLIMDWSGANNGLYLLCNERELKGISPEHVRIIQNEKKTLYELLAQKMPVGFTVNTDPFRSHSTQLFHGDKIYLYSDGYADQFGGPNGKKYKSASFKKFLLDIYEQSLEDQLSMLENEHDSWRGTQEQVDDICTMGITILPSKETV